MNYYAKYVFQIVMCWVMNIGSLFWHQTKQWPKFWLFCFGTQPSAVIKMLPKFWSKFFGHAHILACLCFGMANFVHEPATPTSCRWKLSLRKIFFLDHVSSKNIKNNSKIRFLKTSCLLLLSPHSSACLVPPHAATSPLQLARAQQVEPQRRHASLRALARNGPGRRPPPVSTTFHFQKFPFLWIFIFEFFWKLFFKLSHTEYYIRYLYKFDL